VLKQFIIRLMTNKTKKEGAKTMKNSATTVALDNAGLIVPVNVEALCVGKNDLDMFTATPYDFSQLPTAQDTETPNLSSAVITSGNKNAMKVGIHLHWALPDAITNGIEDSTGKMVFPSIPDRWLVTRVYTDLSNPATPINTIKSWVVESNYCSKTLPDSERESITVPYQVNDGTEGQPYRYLGRVCDYEDWLNGNSSENSDEDYVS